MKNGYCHDPAPKAVAMRFHDGLSLLREFDPELSVSRLAEELGYENCQFLDSLYAGERYHDWSAIEDFCRRARVSESWLKHGKGAPFAPNRSCSNSEMHLLNELEKRRDCWLYFVRSDCETGNLCFVIKENDHVWEVFSTLIHVSSKNGAGGGHRLCVLNELIGRVRERWGTRIFGHTLEREAFDALVSGTTFPGTILARRRLCFWWDDFTEAHATDPMTRERLASHGKEFLAAQSFVRYARETDNAPRNVVAVS